MGTLRSRAVGAAALILLACPGAGRAAPFALGDGVRKAARDGAYLGASPLRLRFRDLLPGLIIGGALSATMAHDRDIRERLAGLRAWRGKDGLRSAGDTLQFGGLIGGVGLLIQGTMAKDERSLGHAWLQAEGFVFATVAGHGVKLVTGRSRPGSGGPDTYKPFTAGSAFPSAHTLNAFMAAQLAAEEYRSPLVRVPAYLAAAAVGASRLAADKHWAGDVGASAVLGVLMGHALHRAHKRPAGDWRLLAGPGAVQVRWAF